LQEGIDGKGEKITRGTWSVTLMEEHILRVSEDRVLRRIFGPKREEVTGEWRRLHDELHNLHASPNIIRVIKTRRMIWAGQVARMKDMRNAYKILVGKPEGKNHLEDLHVDGMTALETLSEKQGEEFLHQLSDC
jgi:hypothetical protein